MRHQVWINVGDFFGNQTVLDWHGAVGERFFIAKSDRPETHQPTARIAHILNIFLKSPRRADGAQLAIGIDHHGYCVVATSGGAGDAGYEERDVGPGGSNSDGAAIREGALAAYVYVVAVGARDTLSSRVPNADIAGAGGVVDKRTVATL